eukprot:6418816-Amphidinium_carterae.1
MAAHYMTFAPTLKQKFEAKDIVRYPNQGSDCGDYLLDTHLIGYLLPSGEGQRVHAAAIPARAR